jgi:hypothetical protein
VKGKRQAVAQLLTQGAFIDPRVLATTYPGVLSGDHRSCRRHTRQVAAGQRSGTTSV